jgi:hypothetical protein
MSERERRKEGEGRKSRGRRVLLLSVVVLWRKEGEERPKKEEEGERQRWRRVVCEFEEGVSMLQEGFPLPPALPLLQPAARPPFPSLFRSEPLLLRL